MAGVGGRMTKSIRKREAMHRARPKRVRRPSPWAKARAEGRVLDTWERDAAILRAQYRYGYDVAMRTPRSFIGITGV